MLIVSAFSTAAEYGYTDEGVAFSWKNNDITCLYTSSNSRIILWSYSPNKNSTTFNGYGWALSPNTTYYGYSPYNEDYLINRNPYTALPISFTGQAQDANDNTGHLGQYDFMTTQATTGESDVTFRFTHLASILRFAIDIPEDETLATMTLSINEGGKSFTTAATMNATNNTIATTATNKELILKLNNISVAKGEQFIAYMMVAPGDYSETPMTLTLTSVSGRTATAKLIGTAIQAGKAYPIDVKALTHFSDQGNEAKMQMYASCATVQQAKGIKPTLPTTNAASIPYPNGYAPDFPIDTEHLFTEQWLMGDANNDGEVTMADANLTLNYSLEADVDYICLPQADMDGNGEITIEDAEAITNLYLTK